MNPAEVHRLLDLADRIAPPGEVLPPDESWHAEITAASAETLVGLAGALNSEPGKPAAKRKALREAVMAEIERKNAEQITATMHLLDAATNALNSRMYWLAVAGVALAVAQIIVAVVPFIPK